MIGNTSAEVLRDPPDTRLIVVSLVIAYGLSLLPLSGAWLLMRPDFPLLLLIYWCMHEPRRVGQTTAFGLGLLVDVADSSVLGLHGLTYSVVAYLAVTLRLRVLSFPLSKQALHVLPMMLLGQGLIVIINSLLKQGFPGYAFFLGSVLSALVWPGLSSLMEARHYPAKQDSPQ